MVELHGFGRVRHTEEMLGGLDGVMSLAAASGEDLGSVSDTVTDSLSAFGLEAKDSPVSLLMY